MNELDPRILEMAKRLGKRPKAVVDHIIKHGAVTTKELAEIYDYNHPPRAARDVREVGIPLETKMITDPITKKRYGSYIFGNVDDLRNDILKGRQNFPKAFKDELYSSHENHCLICNVRYPRRMLQIDHRIPYEVAGDDIDTFALNHDEYMPICRVHNRSKSYSCERCRNWLVEKDEDICNTCFWANPEDYQHIAMKYEKHIELVFRDGEIPLYGKLQHLADKENLDLGTYLKHLIDKI